MRVKLSISIMVLCAGAIAAFAGDQVEQQVIDAPAGAGVKLWPSQPPADCPFKASESFSGVEFSGRNANYTGADTWYPSWAADGNLYSPWTDGKVYGVKAASYGEEMTTGQAKISGDDPMRLELSDMLSTGRMLLLMPAGIPAAVWFIMESGITGLTVFIRQEM
jgi:hypothetical protein